MLADEMCRVSGRGAFVLPILLAVTLFRPVACHAQATGTLLVLETKVPLGEVSGRIDHLGIDTKRQRLFVAELGNDSLGVVDLTAGRVLRTITGFSEPQSVAYVPSADSVYVANGGDGSVRILRGDDLAPTGRIELGKDADNVRLDAQHNQVLVGYGTGALAVIDPASGTKTADIRLKGLPRGSRSTKPGPKSLPMFRTPPKSRSWTSRQKPVDRCRQKA